MRVGLTYDLREDYLKKGFSEEETAEFDKSDTIEAIEAALASLGMNSERIGSIDMLVSELAAGKRWDLVFNIAEGLRGIGREAQVPAVLDAYDIPYTFSDPLVLALTLHKGMTKHVVRDQGVPTPNFRVVESLRDLERLTLEYPLFAKPACDGTSKGVSPQSKVLNAAELRATCCALLERFRQPVLVEEFLPGREFTVGLIGTGDDAEAIGVLEVSLSPEAEQGIYSYENKEHWETLVCYTLAHDELADECRQLALDVWRGLGCRDAGRVDVRVGRDGRAQFIEVNPLAGLNPERSDLPILCKRLGMPYAELISRIVSSALKRVVR
ncbi:MAG: ATP-grasp domain-containing protein [Bdellovibrionota bacterium]